MKVSVCGGGQPAEHRSERSRSAQGGCPVLQSKSGVLWLSRAGFRAQSLHKEGRKAGRSSVSCQLIKLVSDPTLSSSASRALLLLSWWAARQGFLSGTPEASSQCFVDTFLPMSLHHIPRHSHLLCSIWMILSPETERYLCLVPKACTLYSESQRTRSLQFRNRLPKAQLQ